MTTVESREATPRAEIPAFMAVAVVAENPMAAGVAAMQVVGITKASCTGPEEFGKFENEGRLYAANRVAVW
jgi:hypothetical protein